MEPNDETLALRALARGLARSYSVDARPDAILLVGSGATGAADMYSDLDMLLYYDRVPPASEVGRTPRELGATGYRGTSWSDERGYSERFSLDGIECQVGHVSMGSFEREIKRSVVDLEVNDELHRS
jgi:hypothetical protein